MTAIQDLKAGDEVYVQRLSRAFNAPLRFTLTKVVKVTPSGQAVLQIGDKEVRFNAKGCEQGGDGYYGLEINTNTAWVKAYLADQEASRALAEAVKSLSRHADTICGSGRDPEWVVKQLDALREHEAAARDAATKATVAAEILRRLGREARGERN